MTLHHPHRLAHDTGTLMIKTLIATPDPEPQPNPIVSAQLEAMTSTWSGSTFFQVVRAPDGQPTGLVHIPSTQITWWGGPGCTSPAGP